MKQNLLNKLWLRGIMLVAVMTTAFVGTAWAETTMFDFKFETIGSTGWSNSYAAHSYAYTEGTVKFTAASKQTSNITTMPVTKGQPVEFIMEDGYTISAAEFVCQQWASKAQTITLHYSTDGGENYTSTGVTSSNFSISSDDLPSGTNAVKITFSSTSNQIGVKNLTLTYATSGGTVDPSVATTVTIDDSGINNTDVYAGTDAGSLAATVNTVDGAPVTGAIVTWSGNNDAVATIDASTGAVTLVAAGTVKFTASYAGVENEYKASSATYEMTVTDTTPFAGGDVVFESSVLSSETETSLTKSGVTITGSKLGSSYYQAYKNTDFTISTTFGNITQIVFECTSSNPASGFDDAEGFVLDGDNGVWTGEAKEVTLTASNKQVRMTKITVTVEAETPKVLSSITLSGDYPLTFHVGDEFSHEGMTVTANYESGKTADVTASADFTDYDMTTAGVQTVTVSYSEGEVTETAEYEITVYAPAVLTSITLSGTYPTEFEQGDAFDYEGIVVTANYDDNTTSNVTDDAEFSGYDMDELGEQTVTVTYEGKTTTYTITVVEKRGTATNPYTVAQAIAFINTLGSATSAEEVYVHGIISQIDSYNSKYSSITYWISDNGTTTDQLEVYSGKGLNGTGFSSKDDLCVGIPVTVKGYVKMYNSTTPEFYQNNELVSFEETVTVGDEDYATYVAKHNVTFPAGVAYIGTIIGNRLSMTQVTTVPKGTAVVLKNKGTYDLTPAAEDLDDVSSNALLAATEEITADGTQYVLAKPENEEVGFYLVNEGTTIPAGKAYLVYSGSYVNAFTFFFEDDDATGIERNEELRVKNEELGAIYNVAGQRIQKLQKGINIVNGKKVLY